MKPLIHIALFQFFFAGLLLAEVELPAVFSDHMVLQRQIKAPIWGKADPGEAVTVKFRGQEKSTKAAADGTWRLELDPLEAGGPDELTISASNTVTIKDVLTGEVWVGSGQSNMAGNAANYAKRDETLAKLLSGTPYPKLRLLKRAGPASKWTLSDSRNAGAFSALLLSFGQRLQTELDVPVGLIVGAVGGTPSGSWLSKEALKNCESCQQSIADFAKTYDPEAAAEKYNAALAKWEAVSARFKAEGKRVPRKPNPPAGPGGHTRGSEIGGLYEKYIRPVVGYGIRGVLWDQGEAGTAIQGVDQYTLMGGLISGWRNEWGQGEFPFIYIQKPSGGGPAFDPENPITREANPFSAQPAQTTPDGGLYRELHIRIRQHPNTWMVTASDLGSMVHPINKWGYGNRAAQVALKAAYGQDIPVYGPSYASHSIEGRQDQDPIRPRRFRAGSQRWR